MYTAWGSNEYPVSVASLAACHDAPGRAFDHGVVAVGLGSNRAASSGVAASSAPDFLLAGRHLVQKARADGAPFLPTRFYFRAHDPVLLCWPLHLVAPWKRRFYYVGANTYELDITAFARLRLERHAYTRETAYAHCSRFRGTPAAVRAAEFDRLAASIRQNGFNPKFPLRVMLRRDLGLRDMLRDGHHRLLAAREAGLASVPVRFSFAGHAPRALLGEPNPWKTN